MSIIDAITLTKKLISLNTANPPDSEAGIAKYLGGLLSENGFKVEYVPFGDNRLHIVVENGVSDTATLIIFSGHLDVVPLLV